MRWVLILSGLAFMTWGFLFDASVTTEGLYGPTSTLNLDLLTQKLLVFGFGAIQFIAGVVLVAAHSVVGHLRQGAGQTTTIEG